jgi:RNA methyltransferase, TrmH family
MAVSGVSSRCGRGHKWPEALTGWVEETTRRLGENEYYHALAERKYQNILNLAHSSSESPLTARRKGEYKSLHKAKGRKDLGQYLVEGSRALEAAVDAGALLVDVVATQEASQNTRIRGILERVDRPVFIASSRDLESVSDVRTSQGVAAAAVLPDPAEMEAGPCLVLDGIQDPGNVGTLIRTAAWFGVKVVVCGPGTADPYQPKVVRASQGGLWDLQVVRSPDLRRLFASPRFSESPRYVADMRGVSLGEWRPRGNAVLVMGSEAHGISEAAREGAAQAVTIERRWSGGTESLNAAVAGGILLSHWLGKKAKPTG